MIEDRGERGPIIGSPKRHRRVLGAVILTARIIGGLAVLLAVASLPEVRAISGRFAAGIGILSSVVLGLAGTVWLAAVELFLRFFDQYLSRN